MIKSLPKKLLVVIMFAIAMGLLEAVVVVYLRELYYPEGFRFPLITLPAKLINIELVREATTIVMLVCIGLLVGKTKSGRFAWFLFVFGIWDILYYVGLKIFLDWPDSLMTWDILFLIPVTWVGPVIAPVICSVTMILISMPIIFFEYNGYFMKFGKYAWTLLILGASIILFSFMESSIMFLYFEGFFNLFNNDFNPENLEKVFSNFIPEKFNWLLFIIGELFILGGAFHLFRHYFKIYKNIKK